MEEGLRHQSVSQGEEGARRYWLVGAGEGEQGHQWGEEGEVGECFPRGEGARRDETGEGGRSLPVGEEVVGHAHFHL